MSATNERREMLLALVTSVSAERNRLGEREDKMSRKMSRFEKIVRHRSIRIDTYIYDPKMNKIFFYTDRRHEGIQYADREGSAAGERLCEVEFRVRVIVVVLVKELHVAVVY